MGIIQPQVDCTSAKDFLDALSPLGEYFKEIKLSETRLFRGQGQDYPLVPSGFRKNDRLASLVHQDILDYQQRRLAERDALIRFFEIADKRGLILPDDSQQLRASLETLKAERGDDFVGRLNFDDVCYFRRRVDRVPFGLRGPTPATRTSAVCNCARVP